jgi:hypothetical protein
LISGCSVSKRSSTESYTSPYSVNTKNVSINEVVYNNITNRSFNIQKADIKIIQDNVSVRLNASIKYRKPDSLLITIRSKAGLEAGRAFITKDTLLINDRINKTLLIGKPEIIGKKYGINPEMIYAILGDIVINDYDKNRIIKCERGIFKDLFEVNKNTIEYTIDCHKLKVIKSYFEGDITTGNITIIYENIKTINRSKYPETISINDDLKSMNIYIDIKKIDIPWEGTLVFIPGSNYKVVKIR